MNVDTMATYDSFIKGVRLFLHLCGKDNVYANLMRCYDNLAVVTTFYRRVYKHPFLVTMNHKRQKVTSGTQY